MVQRNGLKEVSNLNKQIRITSRYWLDEVARHGNEFLIRMAVNIAG